MAVVHNVLVTIDGKFWALIVLLYIVSYYYKVNSICSCPLRSKSCQHSFSSIRRLAISGWPFGISKLRESAASIKTGSYLNLCRKRFLDIEGNTYVSTTLGKTVIDTCEPDIVQTILSTKFKDWELGEDRRHAFAPLLGHGIFAADGPQWRASRTALRPSFAGSQLGQLEVFEERFRKVRDAINQSISSVDLSDIFGCFTLDCATEIFFGKSTNTIEANFLHHNSTSQTCLSGSPVDKFVDAFNRCQRIMADHLVLGKWSSWLTSRSQMKQYRDDCSTVHQYVNSAVQNSLLASSEHERDNARPSFLQSVVAEGYSSQQISSELINILVAGRDTTASLLGNLWYVLARNPRIYRQLRQEVIDTVGHNDSRVPTPDDLQKMTYLQACVNEALRLYPPVPLNSRVAVRDTTLPVGAGDIERQPIFIPKGMRVAYNVHAMHRRKDLWGADADDFKPERWILPDGKLLRPGWEFLPFNGGPRKCIGQTLALTQARFLTCRLVQHYEDIQAEADNLKTPAPIDSELNDNQSTAPSCSRTWKESLTLTCTSAHGTCVKFLRQT